MPRLFRLPLILQTALARLRFICFPSMRGCAERSILAPWRLDDAQNFGKGENVPGRPPRSETER